jgi:hypothetical protein
MAVEMVARGPDGVLLDPPLIRAVLLLAMRARGLVWEIRQTQPAEDTRKRKLTSRQHRQPGTRPTLRPRCYMAMLLTFS